MSYRWRSTLPGDKLHLHIDTLLGNKELRDQALKNRPRGKGDNFIAFEGKAHGNERVTDATMTLNRENISPRALNTILLRYPLMTLRVFIAIYWQALRLYCKGVPFLGKGESSTNKRELENYEIH